MKIALNIKDKSVLDFFKDKLVQNPNDRPQRGCNDEISPYYFMKDEIFILKGSIEIGDNIEFELFDETRGSRTKLVNRYIYKAEKYDDHSIKMVLLDFGVSIA